MSTEKPLSSIGRPVPELPVADVERAQRYYRDTLGFQIGWLDPGKEIGAVSRGEVAILFTLDDLDGNHFYFHHD